MCSLTFYVDLEDTCSKIIHDAGGVMLLVEGNDMNACIFQIILFVMNSVHIHSV